MHEIIEGFCGVDLHSDDIRTNGFIYASRSWMFNLIVDVGANIERCILLSSPSYGLGHVLAVFWKVYCEDILIPVSSCNCYQYLH